MNARSLLNSLKPWHYWAIGGVSAAGILLLSSNAFAAPLPGEPAISGNAYWDWPVPRSAWLSSAFGTRTSPITGKSEFHNGIDLAAPNRTPLFAAGAGTVRSVNKNAASGNYIIIDHGGGWDSRYAHLLRPLVNKGQTVRRGQLIGVMDSTGMSTGSHIHFMTVLNGNDYRDPQGVIARWAWGRGRNVA